jgi:Tfp pilus assembly protein PilF
MPANKKNPLDGPASGIVEEPEAISKEEAQSPLTDSQVDRIELAMQLLSKRSTNHIAGAFAQALEPHRNRDDKRKIIAGIYAQLYETMLSFRMAMDSSRTVDEIRAALKVRDAEKKGGPEHAAHV